MKLKPTDKIEVVIGTFKKELYDNAIWEYREMICEECNIVKLTKIFSDGSVRVYEHK